MKTSTTLSAAVLLNVSIAASASAQKIQLTGLSFLL
jgi:hypothetical protein